MQLTVLGSGCAMPTARRACSGYLVEWSGHALLMDASAGTYMRALKAGLDPFALRAVAITHLHLDHTADLPAIEWARHQTPGVGDLAIYGPEWRDYPAEIDGLLVEAFPAVHTPAAVCLRLTANGKTLAYSGDTADCDGLRAACRDADVALLECSTMSPSENHMNPADCAAVIEAAGIKRAFLTHLSPEIETTLPKAEDGMVISV